MTRQEAAAGALSGRGSAKRGDVTTSRENERAAQRAATQQPDGVSKGDGTSRGCGPTRSHTTTNRASGRQRCIERWQRWQRHWQNSGNGGLDNNQLKSGCDCDRKGSRGGYGICGNSGGGSGVTLLDIP
jgi:hypothetical protein